MEEKDKSIFCKIEFWNLIILAITLLVLIFYTYYTKQLVSEAIKNNQISLRPLLGLITEYETPFKFLNTGRGPALKGDKNGKMFLVKQDSVVGGLAVNGIGLIPYADVQETDKEKIIQRLPYASDFIAEISKKENGYIAIIYEDMFGDHFASIHNGEGNEFSKAMEFKEIK